MKMKHQEVMEPNPTRGVRWKAEVVSARENLSLPIPPSPCESCGKAAEGVCNKSVNPSHPSSCRKWILWFYEVWPIVTDRLRRKQRD